MMRVHEAVSPGFSMVPSIRLKAGFKEVYFGRKR